MSSPYVRLVPPFRLDSPHPPLNGRVRIADAASNPVTPMLDRADAERILEALKAYDGPIHELPTEGQALLVLRLAGFDGDAADAVRAYYARSRGERS